MRARLGLLIFVYALAAAVAMAGLPLDGELAFHLRWLGRVVVPVVVAVTFLEAWSGSGRSPRLMLCVSAMIAFMLYMNGFDAIVAKGSAAADVAPGLMRSYAAILRDSLVLMLSVFMLLIGLHWRHLLGRLPEFGALFGKAEDNTAEVDGVPPHTSQCAELQPSAAPRRQNRERISRRAAPPESATRSPSEPVAAAQPPMSPDKRERPARKLMAVSALAIAILMTCAMQTTSTQTCETSALAAAGIVATDPSLVAPAKEIAGPPPIFAPADDSGSWQPEQSGHRPKGGGKRDNSRRWLGPP